MRIGELAQASSTSVETIRFYEREGLLAEPARTHGNFRIYTESHVHRLRFIRHCRNLDMTLNEVRVLLRFRDAPQQDCAEVNGLLDAHIGHVSERIRELQVLEQELMTLRTLCHTPHVASECGILNGLVQGASSTASTESPPKRHVRGVH